MATSPTRYEIRVEGVLGEEWSAWFDGLQVASEGTSTVISGEIPDQAALHGLLNRVCDLGLCLISVQRTPNDGAQQKEKPLMSVMQSTQSRAGAAAGAGTGGRRLGVALFVIATAQLMVVLDTAIVNVALPYVQRALGFSGTGLEWVVSAYALTFGGLMLLGGRAGDLLGRRKMFITGLGVFTAASLAGGLATSQAWLIAARAAQGAGAAIVAPTALALITTTFPEGKPRNRAMGVYAV